jgi:HEAT repeat protein
MTPSDEIARLIAALEGDSDPRALAQARLIQLGGAVVEPLMAVVCAQEGRKAWAAAEVLGELADPRAWPVLVDALSSANPMLGVSATKALLRYTGADVLPDFVAALPQAHVIVQQTIILALQRLGDRRAVTLLIDQLSQTESSTIRTALVQTLGKLGDPRAIPALRACLDDENHHVREWSAEALKWLGDPAAE